MYNAEQFSNSPAAADTPTPAATLQKLVQSGFLWPAEGEADKSIRGNSTAICAPFEIAAIDAVLPDGGLSFGAIHEFSFTTGGDPCSSTPYPLGTIPAILIGNALRSLISRDRQRLLSVQEHGFESLIVWVGKSFWPTPFLIQNALNFPPGNSASVLNFLPNCLFIDPPTEKLKLWCLELLLRSPGVTAIIAGMDPISFPLSKRLAIAAKQGGSLGILIFPVKQLKRPSAALTRWQVAPAIDQKAAAPADFSPTWKIKLVRCKGAFPLQNSWVVKQGFRREEYGKAKLSLDLSAVLVNGSSQQAGAENGLATQRPVMQKLSA